ncbi:MAG: type II CRISPR RNA-guided endonuclease Cas9, partial [Myxococcales bacterium]|nr:type II CRISPR RNA-guided endonuclease Cas9 [Myxococcales bacterium]
GHATVGALLVGEPKKRNAPGEYSHTVTRDMIEDEARTLFARQHELGNPHATEALREAYLDIALHQLPIADSEDMVGKCPFEPGERRAAACAYSFERFRYASRLAHLRVIEPTGEVRALSPEERARCLEDFGTSKGITFKALRKRLGLHDEAYFEGVSRQDDGKGRKEKDDVAASRGAAFGAATLRGVVGEGTWNRLTATPDKLDEIAYALSFREDLGRIRQGLEALTLDAGVVDAIVKAAEAGTFDSFKRAGNISAKAARKIVPHLVEDEGTDYRAACVAAGYDPDAKGPLDIRNPVVKRATNEARKQFEVLVREYKGLPGRVCVELARDVGKSPEERDEITKGIERRTAEREARRAELAQLLAHRFAGREPTDDELLRYELWLEQEERCIYTDRAIGPDELLGEGVQVDHVLPRSRSQDNSYDNMVLCTISANQDKRHHTPFEWMGGDADAWHEFEVRVRNGCKAMRWRKKNRLLARSFDEEKFVARNLVDTRYAGRAFHQMLCACYPTPAEAGERRVFVRAGRITSLLRRAWGVDALKYDRESGAVVRIGDDRNHAVDAIVVAAAGEGALQRLTKLYQHYESTGRGDKVPPVPTPWEGFRADVIAARDAILVSRSERRRARGAAHDATIYELRAEDDGREVVYQKKSVEDLKEGDLARVPDAERNEKTVEILRAWIAGADERKRRAKERGAWERERR